MYWSSKSILSAIDLFFFFLTSVFSLNSNSNSRGNNRLRFYLMNQLFPNLSSFSVCKDRYKKEKLIGSGSYAKVYLAVDKENGNYVALKELSIEEGEEMKGRMLQITREVLAMISVSHPFLLKILGFIDSNPFVIVTPYIHHGSLYKYIHSGKRRESLDPTRKTIIMMGIAHAMSVLHGNGIIHRDLKSMNVLLDQYMHPVVCDFGISRFSSESKSMTTQIGTPHWMAPELLAGSTNYDMSVDVYSFAMLLYEVLTGNVPFADLELCDLIKTVCEEGKNPELPHKEEYEESLVKLYYDCSSIEPTKRPSFYEIYTKFKNHEVFFKGTKTEEIDKLIRKLDRYERRNSSQFSEPTIYVEDSEIDCSDSSVLIQEHVEAPTSLPMDNGEPIDLKKFNDPKTKCFELSRCKFALRSSQYNNFLELLTDDIKNGDVDTLAIILDMMKQKKKFIDAFVGMKMYKKLNLESRAGLAILVYLFDTVPQVFSDYTEEMKKIIRFNASIALSLLIKFSAVISKVDDPWPMMDLLIQKSKYFIEIEKSHVYITFLFKLLKDKEYRDARLNHIMPIWATCASMPERTKTCMLSYDCLAYYDSDVQIPTSVLLQCLRKPDIQNHVISYIIRCSLVFDNKITKELFVLAERNTSAIFGLVKIASNDVSYFIKDLHWLERELPTIEDTYRLILTLCGNREARDVISSSSFIASFLSRLLELKEKETEVCALLKCFSLNEKIVNNLSKEGIFKRLFQKLADDELNAVQVTCICKCVIQVSKIGYIQEFDVLPAFLAKLLREKNEATPFIIVVFGEISRHKKLQKELINVKLEKYFKKLAATDDYHEEAAAFLNAVM